MVCPSSGAVQVKVVPLRRKESLRQFLQMSLCFRIIFQWPDSRVASRWNTSGRRPLIRLRHHPNFIRLKLPRACQSPAGRAVIDDNDFFWRQVWPSESIEAPTHSTPRRW
jgi:hypothetical protein